MRIFTAAIATAEQSKLPTNSKTHSNGQGRQEVKRILKIWCAVSIKFQLRIHAVFMTQLKLQKQQQLHFSNSLIFQFTIYFTGIFWCLFYKSMTHRELLIERNRISKIFMLELI